MTPAADEPKRVRELKSVVREVYRKGKKPVLRAVDLSKERGAGKVLAGGGRIEEAIAQVEMSRILPRADVPPGYKPMRHFGPFARGSDFRQVQVVITPTVITPYNQPASVSWNAEWYHNGYFVGHADAAIMKNYYPNQVLPTDATPVQDRSPGDLRPTVLELNEIKYTSRYGGTVRLFFRSNEDFGFEIWDVDSNSMWDIKDLWMSCFVVPQADVLNPVDVADRNRLTNYAGKRIHMELAARKENATAYQIGQAGLQTTLAPYVPGTEPSLEEVLARLASALEASQNLSRGAKRLTCAYLHSEHQAQIPPGYVVDEVEISDDYFNLRGHQGQPWFGIWGRIANISAYSEFLGDPEIKMTVTVFHVLKDGTSTAMVNKTYEMERDSYFMSTPSFFVGGWTLAELEAQVQQQPTLFPPAINIRTDTVEEDPFFDDDLGEFTTILEIDPQAARDQANLPNYSGYGELENLVRFVTSRRVEDPNFDDTMFAYVVDLRSYLELR